MTSFIEEKNDEGLVDQAINTIRFLAVDAVQKVNSGHPGAPMGLAPLAYLLWTRHLRFNPQNPAWFNRDRFILSNGHASMLLYSLLYLTGYDLSLDQLKQFRQWDSQTPGHPEYGHTPGVEATTGPSGQGFANGVGMAIAEKYLQAKYNQPGYEILDHCIYTLVGDGCLEEGVSGEAASLAGHLQLDNLICLYDDNNVTFEGNTHITFTEDVLKRFEAYGWYTERVDDGNNLTALEEALERVRKLKGKPKILAVKTIIGYGSPNKANTAKAHGTPLGKDEVRLTKEKLNWPLEPEFYIPDEVLAHFRRAVERGAGLEEDWHTRWSSYETAHPDLAAQLNRAINREFPEGWAESLPVYPAGKTQISTRTVSGEVLNALAIKIPNLIGGSADLAEFTNTTLEEYASFESDQEKGGSYLGRTLHFGVREHAMGAIINGATLHGGVRIYGATFLVFSDYMRPVFRLAALMNIPSIFIFTHDSIGLGEDGPTYQPVEHLASLRSIPNLTVIRPADANETVYAWKTILDRSQSPTCLILSNQKLPVLDTEKYESAEGVARGAYIKSEAPDGEPQVILISSGSELVLTLKSQEQLSQLGIQARVVSMPSWELFEEQSDEYKEDVLPSDIAGRISVEAGCTMGWETYVGSLGVSLGINHFGASAPGDVLLEKFGFTVETVTEVARKLIQKPKEARALARKIQNTTFHIGGETAGSQESLF